MRNNRARIAITGGVATGKSTVLGILSELGRSTVSADEIARECLNDSKIQADVAKALNLPLPISADSLRKEIFRNPKARKFLNSVIHPLVASKIQASDADFVEIPLLIEACLYAEFDQVWVVWCPLQVQIDRLFERLGDKALAEALIATQLPTEVKEVFADTVVRTNRPLSSVRDHIKRLLTATCV